LKPDDFLAIKKEHNLEKDVTMQLTILLGAISTVAGIINGGYFSLSHFNIDRILQSLAFKVLMAIAIFGSIATIFTNYIYSTFGVPTFASSLSSNIVVCFLIYSFSFIFFHRLFNKIESDE